MVAVRHRCCCTMTFVNVIIVCGLLKIESVASLKLAFMGQSGGFKDFEAYAGSDFSTLLKIKGFPYPNSFKLLKGADPMPDYSYNVSFKATAHGEGFVRFVFYGMGVGDNGLYRLEISNKLDDVIVSRFQLRVLTASLEVLIHGGGDTGKTPSYTVYVGKRFTVDVPVKGYPKPQDLRMNKTGQQLPDGSYLLELVDRSFNEVSVSLKILRVEPSFSGLYTMVMRNVLGDMVKYRFHLNVKEKAITNHNSSLFLILAITIPWALATVLVFSAACVLARKRHFTIEEYEYEFEDGMYEDGFSTNDFFAGVDIFEECPCELSSEIFQGTYV